MRLASVWLSVIGLVIGIILAEMYEWGYSFAVFLFLLGFTFFITGRVREQRKVGVYAVIIFISAGVGVSRVSFIDERFRKASGTIEAVFGLEAEFTAVVASDPDRRLDGNRYIVSVEESGERGDEYNQISSHSKLLIFAERLPAYRYGDRILIKGTLTDPRSMKRDEFDYAKYLEKNGIRAVMFRPEIDLISEGGRRGLRGALFSLKANLLNHIEKIIPEPHSALAGGLLLGVQESLGEKTLDTFRTAGIIHIVVLSGYNITIIIEFAYFFLGKLGRRKKIIIAILFIILFVIMTGSSAATVRAGVMGVIALIARHSLRPAAAGRALLYAVFIMLLYNPKILLADLGFELSVAATAGLIYGTPILERFFCKIKNNYARTSLSLTLATQLAVAPLLLYKMGSLSLISVITNLVVVPIVPLAMLASFFAVMVSYISSFVAFIPGVIAFLLLDTIFRIASSFGSLPYAAFEIAPISLFLALTLYALEIIFFLYLFRKQKKSAPQVAPLSIPIKKIITQGNP